MAGGASSAIAPLTKKARWNPPVSAAFVAWPSASSAFR